MSMKARFGLLDTLVKRIGFGFALVVLILVITMSVTNRQVKNTTKISRRIQQTRTPTALASLTALNGVNQSLASLRGWMLLGDTQFRHSRKTAWEKQIDPALEQMHSLSSGWTNAANRERLERITTLLESLREYQQEIEDVAQTVHATPATEILLMQASPVATSISNLITRMIELEKQQTASENRKKLFASLTDFRGSMGLSLATIRAYLLSGEQQFQDQFAAQWEINTAAFTAINENSGAFTPDQKALFEQLVDARNRFAPLLMEMLEIRGSEQWNLANYWLSTRAAPVAGEIQARLSEMAENQQSLMIEDFATLASQARLLQQYLWLLLIIGVVTAVSISIYTTRSITKPLGNTILAANAIAVGDLDISQEIVGIREFDALRQSMETIIGNLKGVAAQADIVAQGNYDVTFTPLSDADQLGHSLVGMTENLRDLDADIQRRLWLADGLTTLASIMEGDQEVTDLANAVINTLCELVEAQVGAIFVREEDTLRLAGTYAYVSRKNLSDRWKTGEGLVGQAALKKQTIVVSNVPEDYIHITSGLGETPPRHIVVSPLLNEGVVLGVVEIGSVTALPDQAVELLNQASYRIAIAFDTAAARSKLLQRQAELVKSEAEIKSQNEKLALTSKYKSQFLANMSHEIRTPMNAIIGLTHLLQRTNPTQEQMERLDGIDISAKHLLSIINDILDLSKIEGGKLTLEYLDFHLDTVFDQVQSLLREQIRSKGLTIEVDRNEVPLWLKGDPTRLRQALLNYASNAVKFTKQGTIYLRAKKLENYGDEILVRFEVQDSGIGIEPDKLASVFKAFEQADVSTTRQYGGTGLGLTITRNLAQLMGGEVGVESVLGQGSTFWLTARFGRGHGVLPEAPTEEVTNAETQLRTHHAGARVLLADDNIINREVAVALLSSAGLVVDTAENGKEAVAMVRETDYELVLMDIQMPEMDGLEATRMIRSTASNKNIPILAMTAHIYETDRQECLEAGMNDFVAKPVDLENLFSVIAEWLPS